MPSYLLNLQDDAVAIGDGTSINVLHASVAVVQVTGITTATITWEGTVDETNWVSLIGKNVATGTEATTATADGIYSIPVTGMSLLRAPISAYTTGTIVANALTTDNPTALPNTTIAAISSITSITNALPAGNNNIGDVDVASVPQSIRGPSEPTIDSYASVAISVGASATDSELVAAPGASKQIWVYGITGTADTADGTVSIQDSDNTALTGVMAVANKGGFAIGPSGNFSMPIWKVATNKALEMDTVTCGFKGVLSYAIVSV